MTVRLLLPALSVLLACGGSVSIPCDHGSGGASSSVTSVASAGTGGRASSSSASVTSSSTGASSGSGTVGSPCAADASATCTTLYASQPDPICGPASAPNMTCSLANPGGTPPLWCCGTVDGGS